MSRGNVKIKKREIKPDKKFEDVLLSRFINYVMDDGKRQTAEKIVYSALEKSSLKIKKEPIEVFDLVLRSVGPIVEIRGKRIGGANYQVPVEVGKDRRNVLAMRWIIKAARDKKGSSMANKLADEMIMACRGEGSAVKKREETHKMAEANKAFAHFARF